MSWRTLKVEEQRYNFIKAYLEEKFNLSDLCKQFDISRPCAYKWIKRFEKEGLDGLKNKSKVPFHSPTATPPEQIEKILNVKYQWPKWGPKKVLGYLTNNNPDIKWPSVTTIENVLKKNGLVERRKLRRRFAKKSDPLGECNLCNDIWCIDFKGWWLTKDHQKCDPFTLTDAYSRYLLCCQKLKVNDSIHVWAVFERLFREYGLPLRVRSDNGPPFATLGAGRLSKLSINLIKAGVIPEWIEPGEPQQNGRHERMHLTLKQESVDLEGDLNLQIKKLEEFSNYYNFIRPHEALGQKCPGDIYKPSPRYWNGKLKSPEYPCDYQIGKVKGCGQMSWKGREVYIGRVLEGELIGLKQEEENLIAYYGPIYLGIVRERNLEIKRRPGRIRK
jgi:putative transposase